MNSLNFIRMSAASNTREFIGFPHVALFRSCHDDFVTPLADKNSARVDADMRQTELTLNFFKLFLKSAFFAAFLFFHKQGLISNTC